jgi:hypothetical protein
MNDSVWSKTMSSATNQRGNDMQAKTIEKSIFWQQQVIKQSRDPVQIARCKAAIQRLQDQLKGATA